MDYRNAWISTGKALPEKEGEYIVSISENDGYKTILLAMWITDVSKATMTYSDEGQSGFVIWEWRPHGSPWKKLTNVTAWMEAPEAYG